MKTLIQNTHLKLRTKLHRNLQGVKTQRVKHITIDNLTTNSPITNTQTKKLIATPRHKIWR